MSHEIVEDFFVNRTDMGKIFEALEKGEYLFLYNIEQIMEQTGEDRAYMSDLAEHLNLSVIETSRAVKNLEDRGFVTWKTDENKERTFVTLTTKAQNAMECQNDRMERSYRKITEEIPEEDLHHAISTMARIREIIKDVK